MGDIEAEIQKRKEMRHLSISLIVMSGIFLIGDGALKAICNQFPTKEESTRINFRDSSIGMINWILVASVAYCFFQYGVKLMDSRPEQELNPKSANIQERYEKDPAYIQSKSVTFNLK